MILPTKGISPDRSLVAMGSHVLDELDFEEGRSSVELWHSCNRRPGSAYVGYDWFCLALSLLYSLGLIGLRDGLIRRVDRA